LKRKRKVCCEISILRDLKHPNIVDLKDVINLKRKPTLLLEFLYKDRKKFMDAQRRIIHRDMKPQNLLLNRQGLIKLWDFALACTFTIPLQSDTHEVITLWYRALEILLGSQFDLLCIDVWAVDCIVSQMFPSK
jgi:serine/threonine protein kinase